jgi:hypothetical protein
MKTIVRSVAKSLERIASTVIPPRPGMPKNDSSRSEPVNRKGIDITIWVRIGIRAFRSTWRVMIRTSEAPFARAVRTKSRVLSSMKAVR